MSCIIRAYFNDTIRSVDLSENDIVTIGGDSTDSMYFDAIGLSKAQVTITKSANGYIIKGKRLYNSENSRISSDIIEVGKQYLIDCKPEVTLSVHPKQADADIMLGIANIKEVTIGRSRTSDIMLVNKKTSSKHCKILKKDGAYRIKDLDSRNGTFVNGKKVIRDKIINDGDVINISIYQILFSNNSLTFYNVGNDMDINDAIIEDSYGSEYEKSEKAPIDTEKNTYRHRSGTISIYASAKSSVSEKSADAKGYKDGDQSKIEPIFEVENNIEVTDKVPIKKGTVSMFDVNININIDEDK